MEVVRNQHFGKQEKKNGVMTDNPEDQRKLNPKPVGESQQKASHWPPQGS